MSNVVSSLAPASSSAASDRERRTIVPRHVSHVGALSIAVERSVDGGVTEIGVVGVAGDGLGADGVDGSVAVATSNDDLEVVAPLAVVDGVGGIDGGAPEDTLNQGGGGWVVAAGARVDGGRALESDVDGLAASDGVALGSAGGGVVGVEESVAHVAISVVLGLEVRESGDVAAGSGCVDSDRGDGGIREEGGCSVRARNWASTGGLGGSSSTGVDGGGRGGCGES